MPIVTESDGSSTVMTRQRARVVGVGERLADRHLGEAGDGDDLARPGLVGVDAVERLGDVELGDLARSTRAVGAAPGDRLALADRAVAHAADREAADVGRRVEVGDVRLQRVRPGRTSGAGMCSSSRSEQRLEVACRVVGRRSSDARPAFALV